MSGSCALVLHRDRRELRRIIHWRPHRCRRRRDATPANLRSSFYASWPYHPSVSAGRTPRARKKANSQSRSPPMATSSQNCTRPWTHACGRASVSSTNVGAGCGCRPTSLFIMRPAPVPCHSVWPQASCMLAGTYPVRTHPQRRRVHGAGRSGLSPAPRCFVWFSNRRGQYFVRAEAFPCIIAQQALSSAAPASWRSPSAEARLAGDGPHQKSMAVRSSVVRTPAVIDDGQRKQRARRGRVHYRVRRDLEVCHH